MSDTYSLGLLVLIHSLVRRVRKVNLRAQLRDDVMAASKKKTSLIIVQTQKEPNCNRELETH